MFQLKPNYERKLRSVQDSSAMMSVRKVALYMISFHGDINLTILDASLLS